MPFSMPLTMFFVAITSIIGGIIQGSTGFGFGIFVMIFFPNIMPYLMGVGLSSIIGFGAMGALVYKYRKYIKWKFIPVPLAFYYIASTICINLSTKIDTNGLKVYLGIFFIILAFYFAFFNGKIKLKPNVATAAVVSLMSGTLSGFFSIGGPPMVIYFLSGTDSKEEYLGTCQTFFLLTSVYNTLLRIFKGIITLEIIPYAAAGYIGIGLGMLIAAKIVDKIDAELMKKLIYAVIGLSGVWMLVSNI